MSSKKTQLVFLTALTGLLLTAGMLSGLSAAASRPEHTRTDSVDRRYDPVILKGAQLHAQLDPPIDELALYRFQAASWTPIPFQIDEVDLTGTLVLTGDGRLSSQDELVWMAWDGGDQAPLDQWPADPFARLNPRIEIRYTDPLSSGAEAWVYLFRSPTIPRANNVYISWDFPSQTAAAISYSLAFDHANFFGFADLAINGTGVDILDRQKVRGTADFFGFNEEDLAEVITSPIQFSAQGPVRLASGSGIQRLEFFGRGFRSTLEVETTLLPLPLTEVRTSLDFNNPAITGLGMYFDSNTPGGVPIDGVQDPISPSPLIDWYQVSGNAAAPGGLVVIWDRVDGAGGTVTNFYLDDENANDPGDGAAYADAGITVSNPGPVISLTQAVFVLPPGTSDSVGAVIYSQYQNPLETTHTFQSLGAPFQVYLPVVRRP